MPVKLINVIQDIKHKSLNIIQVDKEIMSTLLT